MARSTVEDCLDFVANRFELVMVGSKRARQLATGGRDPMVPWENDKPTVVALREIEEGFVNASILDEREDIEMEIESEEFQASMNEAFSEMGEVVSEEANPEAGFAVGDTPDAEAPEASGSSGSSGSSEDEQPQF